MLETGTKWQRRGLTLGIWLLSLGAGISPAQSQVVSPFQSGHYMPAITGVRDMATPPPGLFVAWYNWYGFSDTYVDRNGNRLSTLELSKLDPSLTDLDIDTEVTSFATVPVLFYASPFKLFGGTFMAALSPSWVTADYAVALEAGGPGGGSDGVESSVGSVSGWGDLFVSPFGLSWTGSGYDITGSYGFYAPTGRYEAESDDNVGLGFWTHQFQGMGYFYPTEDRATALMVGGTFELNAQVKDSNLTPGNRFTLEWGVSQYFTERLELTAQGGFNWQITDDDGEDLFWDPSYHDKKHTAVFGLAYWPWVNRVNISAKYGFDFGAKQRFDGDALMLNFIIIPGWLEGS